MERHDAGEAIVIPVILRACDWLNSPLGKLNATPRDGKPVKQHEDQDEALLEVVHAVREAAGRMAKISIEPEGKPETGTNPGPVARRLSAAARELLIAASRTSGVFYYDPSERGSLEIDGRHFIQPGDAGSSRKWSRVLKELKDALCLKEDWVDDIAKMIALKVTDLGHDAADIAKDL